MYKRNNNEKRNICLICFTPLMNSFSFSYFLSFSSTICQKCKSKFKVLNKHEVILGVNTWFLYEYNSFIKTLIYNFKGCYDYILKDVFLDSFKVNINIKYKGYTIIYPPSSKDDNIKRGFNHMQAIASCLSLPYIEMFYKCKQYKQSDQHFNLRKNIANIIKVKHKIVNQKYLIIDDIYTSGSTLNAIIKILVKNGVSVNNIKAIIIAKVVNNVEL